MIQFPVNLGEKSAVVLDIEANGLKPDIIWCIVCYDLKTGEYTKFHPSTPRGSHNEWRNEFKKFIEKYDYVIGHNIISYDLYWIGVLLDIWIPWEKCIDTLVLSRLFRAVTPFKDQIKFLNKKDSRLGGHGLEAWGGRLGYAKIKFNDWEKFSEEMLVYCTRDVELNYKVYLRLCEESIGFSAKSIELEHRTAWLLAQQERNGFYLDQDKCKYLRDECSKLLSEMTDKLQELFPPVPKLVREYKISYNKDGTISKVSKRILTDYYESEDKLLKTNKENVDVVSLYRYETFNPKSSKQIAERLLSVGWEPKVFTPAGNPKTDKVTISGVIDELIDENPELESLVNLKKYNIIADRLQKSEKWLELVEDDGRVHGRINPIGAGTHRCAHYADNMANIASVSVDDELWEESDFYLEEWEKNPPEKFSELGNSGKLFLGFSEKNGKKLIEYVLTGIEGNFGWESRDCWTASTEDHCIVGADASGIQLRALAHYMNDPEYTKKLLEADIHEVHQHAAGISTRAAAKRFIYAWLLGAGDPKIGLLVGTDPSEYSELFAWAQKYKYKNFYSARTKNKQNLLDFVRDKLRKSGVKASRKNTATAIKGFKVKEQFLNRTPALKRLKEVVIPQATKEGYMVGLDGRKLWIPNEHLAMSMYLQGFEAVIMKAAMIFYHNTLNKLGIPFRQVAFVHDEFQIECLKKDAQVVGQAVVEAIRKAGEVFKVNCPLDGEFKVGHSWAQTH